jgi:hypothetical protein
MREPTTEAKERWLGPGVAGISTASFLADIGHGLPTALLPELLTATFGAPPPPSGSSRASWSGRAVGWASLD